MATAADKEQLRKGGGRWASGSNCCGEALSEGDEPGQQQQQQQESGAAVGRQQQWNPHLGTPPSPNPPGSLRSRSMAAWFTTASAAPAAPSPSKGTPTVAAATGKGKGEVKRGWLALCQGWAGEAAAGQEGQGRADPGARRRLHNHLPPELPWTLRLRTRKVSPFCALSFPFLPLPSLAPHPPPGPAPPGCP